ncbi:DUF2125 domain-containing protein [Tabrizicola sp.]|uniref:DUF2125 domain-containing protein n=1 Tax=Tabrizicola sp. TaxID=2005166 RepID=UPI002FDCB3F6
MTRALTSSTAMALVFLASGAWADVTPQEVWASWQAMMTSAGQELTVGNTADSGQAVEVTDLAVTYKDQMGGSASISLDKLAFKDNGDGTVTVTMPDSYPVQMAFPDKGEGPGSIKLTVSQPGVVIVAGGSAGETSYKFTAPTMTITLDEVTDHSGKMLDTKGDLALGEVAGAYLMTKTGETMGLDSTFTAKSAVFNLSGSDGEDGGSGKVSVSFADLSGATKGNFLNPEMMANMALALNSGFTMDTSFSFGAMAMDFDIIQAQGPTKLVANATGGSFVLAMNKDRMTYGSSLDGAKFTISGAEIPFPQVELAFAESGFNVVMPVTKSDTPQDFAFLTKVVDFTVSEDIWGLFDPAGTLARDPATFIVDLKGTGFWKQDIMDPSVQMEGATPPGELHSLDLTQVLAKAAGAEVSATGGLTFDNSDLATFGGVPRPDGKVTVNIKGVTKLVDNLIALGILSQDDAMGFRMGLAMFAKPGAGPDELVSEIEFKEGGFFANGMRMQ